MPTPDWGMRVYGSSKTEDAQSLVTDGTNELTPVKHSLTHESGNVYFLQASASNQVCSVLNKSGCFVYKGTKINLNSLMMVSYRKINQVLM
jgi:hypothetical protein